MIDRRVNPFIVDNKSRTQFESHNLGHLSNLPTKKSVYFTTQPVANFGDETNLTDPWFYTTGVFDGKFGSVVGQGASGVVLSGEWHGQKAAFKHVEIESRIHEQSLKSLDEKLSEMTSIQSTRGSKIVSFYGHYR